MSMTFCHAGKHRDCEFETGQRLNLTLTVKSLPQILEHDLMTVQWGSLRKKLLGLLSQRDLVNDWDINTRIHIHIHTHKYVCCRQNRLQGFHLTFIWLIFVYLIKIMGWNTEGVSWAQYCYDYCWRMFEYIPSDPPRLISSSHPLTLTMCIVGKQKNLLKRWTALEMNDYIIIGTQI